jgi:SAM-dependent methyltransferase
MKVLQFSDAAEVSSYYDKLYAVGYMDAVGAERIDRIAGLLRDAGLSPGQLVLDFGCGIGNLTAALAAQFPGVRFSGCDISPYAVERAKASDPGISFFVLTDASVAEHAGAFDFVISNHVLEHVADPAATARTIAAMTKPRAVMIHALPSGNPGSMEQKIAALYRSGIEVHHGNRFFFEDPSHLRRLTSNQVADLFAPHRFALADALFANQYWGSIDWITNGDPRVPFILFRPLASDADGRLQLAWMLLCTKLLTLARMPLRFCRELVITGRRIRAGLGNTRALVKAAVLALTMPAVVPLLLPSGLIDAGIKRRARSEWERSKRTPYGSEMYLVLRRVG